MEEDTDMQEIMNKTPNFEEQENGSYSRKCCINCSQCCMTLLIVMLVLTVLLILGFIVLALFIRSQTGKETNTSESEPFVDIS